jgi:hypothetical protein
LSVNRWNDYAASPLPSTSSVVSPWLAGTTLALSVTVERRIIAF